MSKEETPEEFGIRLKTEYPLLYRDMFGNPMSTCMAFGIETNRGWWPLIEGLSAELEPVIREIKEEAERYPNLVCEDCLKSKRWHWFFFISSIKCFFRNLKLWPKCAKARFKNNWGWFKTGSKSFRNPLRGVFTFPSRFRACREFRVPFPCAAQVKEKFGTLRFYMTTYDDEIENLICKAEVKSGKTCERCGKPGKLRDSGWWVTLCDACKGAKDD